MIPVTVKKKWSFALVGSVMLLAGLSAFAQNSLQGDTLREVAKLAGLGIVGREIAGETDCRPNASGDRGIPPFDSVNGQATARLEWRIDRHSCGAFLVRNNKREKLYRGWDHPESPTNPLGLPIMSIGTGSLGFLSGQCHRDFGYALLTCQVGVCVRGRSFW
jgi:hypothetical protein